MIDVARINQLELFSVLSEDQFDKLLATMEELSFQQDDRIYQRGERAGKMYIVLDGLVSLRQIDPGDEVGIAYENRAYGEFFGSASFMVPQEYTLTAVCLKDTTVISINADQLFDLFKEDPVLGYRFMKKIAQIYFHRYKTTKRQIHQMVNTPTIITALPG